jgi:hypothetical protein
LAVKFPVLASSMCTSLRDFLVTPSPILSKLNKYATSRGHSSIKITVTDSSYSSQSAKKRPSNKLLKCLENLRDCAIMNICKWVKDYLLFLCWISNPYLLTLPLFAGVSRVRALSPAWTGSHAREILISCTHLFLPHDIPPTKNQVQ